MPEEHVPAVVTGISKDPVKWVDFMMRFELGLERPDPKRLLQSPLTIGGAYIAGGFLPLLPYIVMTDVTRALLMSVAVSLVALLAFGAFKGYLTGQRPVRTAIHTAMIGSLAGGVAYLIAHWISH